MTLSMTLTLVGLVQWIAPILVCGWAVRAHKSRTRILLASVASAVFAGAFMVIPLVQASSGRGEGVGNIWYVLGNLLLSSAILGAITGVAGIIVRTVASRRQRLA